MTDLNQLIEDSNEHDFNSEEVELFLTLKQSKSSDSFLGKLKYKEPFEENKNMIFPDNRLVAKRHKHSGRRRRRGLKKKSKPDYNKNICGYITKKILREFIS